MSFNAALDDLDYHPEPSRFADVLVAVADSDMRCLAELWLSEGIPAAFIKTPTRYQQARVDLANGLGVGVKDVSLVGSGRLGFSLAPKKYGVPFGDGSDLDICVINSDLYERLRADANKFITDYQHGFIVPRPAEANFWADNVGVLKRNMGRGFVDANKIPNRDDRYQAACKANDVMSRLSRRVATFEGFPKLKRSTVRVYRDWHAMARQVSVNLGLLSKALLTERSAKS